MQRFKTFFIFLILTAVWSAFFSTIKFFLWWDLKTTVAPDLQTLAGYLSLWGVIAYLIWGAIAYTFVKKYVLFFVSFISLIFTVIAYKVGIESSFFLSFIMISLGVLYWLWSVVKNILIAVEIKKTWLPDTTVNAVVGITFVVFVIAWSIIGSLLFEKLWNDWFKVIIWMLAFTSIVSLFLDYDNITLKSLLRDGFKSYYFERKGKFINSMRDYFPDVKYITTKYFSVIITSSLLWAISTIVSQKAVEYSVVHFDKDPSSAAFLLLFSAVWVIVWNLASVKMDTNRWKNFKIFNTLFALLIFVFPFFSISFQVVSIMAFVVWIFFWIASNLIDAYFFKKIWDENKKEYWASTYGLILSVVIFVMMFVWSYINSTFSYEVLMVTLWFVVLSLSFLNFNNN